MCSRRIIGLVIVSVAACLLPSMAEAELVGYWTFDEGTGLALNDSSGNANTGTLTNMTGTEWQAGRSGAPTDYSLAFDGLNDVVVVPDSPSVSLTGDMTLSAWINVPSLVGSSKNILAKDSNSAYRWRVEGNTGNLWTLLSDGAGSPTYELFSAGVAAPESGWHHTAVTANFGDSKVRFYLDGELVSTKNMASTVSIQDTGGSLCIGAYNAGGTEGFAGNLDDVAIFNQALSNAQVKQLASGQPVLLNPSFEEDSFTVYPGYVSGNGPIAGWTNSASGGLNPVVGGSSPFANNGTIPDGDQVAFIQRGPDHSLSQTAVGFQPGETYLVTYRENSRSPHVPPLAAFMIDAETLVPEHAVAYVGGSNPYYHVAAKLFTASSSAHTLKFINNSEASAGDNTLLLDDVRIHRMYLKFSDDFSTIADTLDINPSAGNDAPGRQGGHFAPLTYAQTNASDGQIAGDRLLIAGTGINIVSPNHNFNLNGLGDAHFVLEFEVEPGSATGDDWAAVVFGSSSQTASVNGSDGIGMLFRDSGSYQIFDGTSANHAIESGTLPGAGGVYDMQIHYFVPGFDDTTPGMVDIWANGVLVHSFITDSGFANNYINFVGYSNETMNPQHAFDNFSIYSSFVPEPGSLSLLALGGLLLLGRIRRRRK